jgi:hypothetical protein
MTVSDCTVDLTLQASENTHACIEAPNTVHPVSATLSASPSLLIGHFRPRPCIGATRVRDVIVLLDTLGDRYVTLNEVAAEIWEGLDAGLPPATVVDRIHEQYDAPLAQVTADVSALINVLLRQHLIERDTTAPTGRHTASVTTLSRIPCARSNWTSSAEPTNAPLPSHLQCASVLVAVKLLLTIAGYRPTLRWVQRRVEGIPTAEGVSVEVVRRIESRVALVAAVYPGRALCLEQSLALYMLLRRRGVAAKYCAGVQPHPFLAHAWVEYRSQPVNDVLEHVQCFVRLPEQLP